MKENFNPSLRRESMALSQSPDLHQLVQAELASIFVLPERDSPEALAIDEAQKPLRYALLAQAIEAIVSMPPTLAPEDFEDPLHRKGFRLLSAYTSYDYIQRVKDLFGEDGNDTLTNDLYHLSYLRRELRSGVRYDPQEALIGGVGTFNSIMTILLEKFNNLLDGFAINAEAKKTILERSYASLIDVASFDSLQLAGVLGCLYEDQFPELSYDPQGRRITLNSSPLDQPITEMVREGLIERGFESDAKTVRELDFGSDIIGCPVLFRPGQVKKIWQYAVESADRLNIL